MRLLCIISLIVAAEPIQAFGETVVASHTIRSQTILVETDLQMVETKIAGDYNNIDDLVGLETRETVYKGRPILAASVGPAAVIDRNQIVKLFYRRSGLLIETDARALGRAGVGDRLKVMNLESRKTVFGLVNANGDVVVSASEVQP
jgi:flagella basal body P-ring formation protein FlgA